MQRYYEVNGSGHNVRCKLYCNDIRDIRQVVVFIHGFGGHKDNGAAARFGEVLLSKHRKAALITFDLPCHGDDVKKKLNFVDCLEYIRMVVADARQRFGTEELYAYATSFGGWLTLNYLHRNGNPFRKLVLRCPAVPMYDVLTTTIMVSGDLTRLSRGKDIPVGFDRKVPVGQQFLADLRENDIRRYDYLDYAEDILILHGTADEVVPMDAAAAFCEEQLIEFIPIEGADHRFRHPRAMDQAIKAILTFFSL